MSRYKVALTVQNNGPSFFGVFDTRDPRHFNGELISRHDSEESAKRAAAYREQCAHPGKFEGCAAYVPYYWDAFLNGCADRDDGHVLGFDVRPEDKALFPELKRRRTVRLEETDSGFVVEV